MKEYGVDYDNVVDNLELLDIKTIMDVGGGIGTLLLKILIKYNNIKKAILLDLPSIISHAKKYLYDINMLNKIQIIHANFFEKIPVNLDVILLSRVLHNWDDFNALKILKNVYNVLENHGKLYIIETIIPENLDADLEISLNFNLLVMTGGKERTLKEFEKILTLTNFDIFKVKKTYGILLIIIVKKH